MTQKYDVIVLGGGCAGVAAAISAAKNGARTLLVEQGPVLGGDLLSGLPIDGCLNARGEWIVGGVARELFDACQKRGGYIGPICDYRALWMVCLNPRVMQFAIVDVLRRAGVELLLYSFCDGVEESGGEIHGVHVTNKMGRRLLRADVYIDCTGDGDVALAAGAPYEQGGQSPEDLQPVSLIYSLSHVDTAKLLHFAKEHPENLSVGESEWVRQGRTDQELVDALVKQGCAKIFFVGSGPLMSKAIGDGLLSASSLMATIPNCTELGTVSINSTRVPVDATKTDRLSNAVYTLYEQIDQAVHFLKARVPGFEQAVFAGAAPRIGIRETRRIMGEYVLTDDDVLMARKRPDGIAKGGHEYDIHGSGTGHIRRQLKDGGSYDIPYGCLLPLKAGNLLMAGRQLSASRGAHSSARVMGTCMAMGQAAGTAAAMCAKGGLLPRDIRVETLRETLFGQGAVLEGTY